MNAANKNEPSMFKVGDKVVFVSGLNAGLFTIKSKPKKNNGVLLLPVILPNGSWFDLMEQFVRHATPEEIAARHRIDHFVDANNMVDANAGVTVITPKGTSKIKGGMVAFVDMGDDSHIENHVSPLCKVGVK